MRKRLIAVAGIFALAFALAAGPALAASTISGTVSYTGKVPNLKPIDMAADPACAAKHSAPVKSEVLVLGPNNTMANVMVRVKSPVAGNFAAPSTPAVIDQKGCHYSPHVLGVQVGQTLKLKNSDGILHNVHALPKVNTPCQATCGGGGCMTGKVRSIRVLKQSVVVGFPDGTEAEVPLSAVTWEGRDHVRMEPT